MCKNNASINRPRLCKPPTRRIAPILAFMLTLGLAGFIAPGCAVRNASPKNAETASDSRPKKAQQDKKQKKQKQEQKKTPPPPISY